MGAERSAEHFAWCSVTMMSLLTADFGRLLDDFQATMDDLDTQPGDPGACQCSSEFRPKLC